MKTRTMMKVLIATVATIGVSSVAMADSAGRNSDVAAPKVTGKPKPVDECVFVRQMMYADATDVKTCIDTLVIEDRKNAAEIGFGMIWGKVIVVADKRTNKLFIVTIKPNMDFFDKLIEQLDVDDRSPSIVKEFRVRNAYAEDIAQTINDFFGAPNAAVEGFVKARADKRINGLVVMAEKSSMPIIEHLMSSMDIKVDEDEPLLDAAKEWMQQREILLRIQNELKEAREERERQCKAKNCPETPKPNHGKPME